MSANVRGRRTWTVVLFSVFAVLGILTGLLLYQPVYPTDSDNGPAGFGHEDDLPCSRVIKLIISGGITPDDVLSGGEKLPSVVDHKALASCNQHYETAENWAIGSGTLSLLSGVAGAALVLSRRRLAR